MGGGLFVTHEHVAELRVVVERVVEGQNRATRIAEDGVNALPQE